MSDIPEESENAFLGTIHSTNSHTTEWLVELYFNEGYGYGGHSHS